MPITVKDLKVLLTLFPEDSEVRLMTQPSWPFEYSIDALVGSDELGEDFCPANTPDEHVVYIIEGLQLGSGTKEAWM